MNYQRFSLPDFRMIPKRDYALAVLSGVLLALSFPKAGIAPLAWISFIPLLITLHKRTFKQAFWLGWISGVTAYSGLLYWVNIVMTTYGKLPLLLSFSLYLMLAAYLALYTGAAAFIVRISEESRITAAVSFPFAWIALEYIRSVALTGFPWALLGYSQYKILPLVQIADIFGVYGLSFLIAMTNAVGLLIIRGFVRKGVYPQPLKSATLLSIALFLSVWYGLEKLNKIDNGSVMKVSLIQGNIPQDVKWDPAFQEATVKVYELLTREGAIHGTDLVIWPESALPLFYQENQEYSDRLKKLAIEIEAALLFGSPAFERSNGVNRYLNSAFLIDDKGVDVGRSDKIHLVPFGEYVPMAKLIPFVHKMVSGIGDFVPGDMQESLKLGKRNLGVLVCFEGIFPEIAREYVLKGSNLLVNITNDAWFGKSSAPWQHLSMSVFRAVENRTPLVRSANTGISAIITSSGEIDQPSELFREAVVSGEVRVSTGNKTFYTKYGDLLPKASVVITICYVSVLFFTRKKRGD